MLDLKINAFDKAKVYDEMDYAQTKLLITEFLSRNKSQTRDNL